MNNYISIFKLSGTISEKMEQICFLLCNLFVFFLPFDKFYSTIILLMLLGTMLVDFRWQKIKNIPKQFWIFQLVFFLSFTGYFYSVNKSDASFLIERQAAILVFPILLPLAIQITKKRIEQLLLTLTISVTLSVLFLFFYHFYFQLYLLNIPLNNIVNPAFFNHSFSALFGIHAGYYSMYISLSISYVLMMLFRKIATLYKILLIGVVFILFVGLIFLSARSILIYTVITTVFLLPFYLENKRNKYILIGSSLIVIVIGILAINNNTYLKNRFTSQLSEDIISSQSFENMTVNEPRIERWKLGVELALKSPFVGHGTGDEVMLLKEKYKEKKYIYSYVNGFNVHNQYLSIFIKHGIIGLCIFLGMLFYFYTLVIRAKEFMYLAFLFGITFFFLTENVLDANKGIFYFSFFNAIFGYYSYTKKRLD